MKELFIEYGYVSLNKFGEELCGDKVESVTVDGYTTLVLADGLGSGVKANILSTLSSKILCTMVSNNIPIEDCIETMIQTLPVCKVRGVAYSTFSVIHVDAFGRGYLFEFDNPQAVYYHEGHCVDFDRKPVDVLGKKVYHSELNLGTQSERRGYRAGDVGRYDTRRHRPCTQFRLGPQGHHGAYGPQYQA